MGHRNGKIEYPERGDQCPLWVKGGHSRRKKMMSALPPKADMRRCTSQCLLQAKSGHTDARGLNPSL
jgi:hypothetical protein